MAQHDYVIANGTGAAVRSDLNNGLAAIVSQNSGTTEPTTTYAYMRWADTTAGVMKMRNGANNAWITLYQLDGEWSTIAFENGSAAAPSIYFKDSGTDTGFYSPAANEVAVATNGTGRLFVDASGRVGLGVASPGYPVDLVSQSGESIRIRGTSGTEISKLLFTSNNAGTDYGWLSSASSYLAFGTAATERMRLTSTGLGIGTTSPGTILDVVGSGNPTLTVRGSDGAYTGIVNIQAAGGGVSSINATGGGNALKIETNSVERARIDSSGRLLVGTSSSGSNARVVIQGSSVSSANEGILRLANGSATPANGVTLGFLAFTDSNHSQAAAVYAVRDGGTWTSGSSHPSYLGFSTTADGASSPTERVRVDSAGRTMFGKPFNDTSKGCQIIPDDNNTGRFHAVGNGSGSGAAYYVTDASGVAQFVVRPNGNVLNLNNSYGSLSDAKLKENITDATSQWSDIKSLQVRKYNLKEGQTHTQIGLVAQEVELVSPGLVRQSPDCDAEGNDLGTVTKSVNYSVLYMKAVKALQEAMERIEQLETNNADLLARVTALEAA